MLSLHRPKGMEENSTRLPSVRPTSQRQWGMLSAHPMIIHLSDAFRIALGENPSPATRVFEAVILWVT
jgi:hypothetical protein